MSGGVSAAPARRDRPALACQTIQDFTTGALDQFLSSKNADGQPFNVNGPWSTIDFAGQTGALLSQGEINNEIFISCDNQMDRASNQTLSFSQGYKDFIQDVNKAVPPDPPSQEMNQTTAAVTSSCYGSALTGPRSQALAIFNNASSTPTTNTSDPAFLSWASNAYPPYMNAYTACQQALTSYYAAVDSNDGDDAGVYTSAREHIQPLLDESTSSPGINMPIQATSTTGSTEGSFVPSYDIPTLNSTLIEWQNGNGLSKFSFTSASYNASSSLDTKFGGASLGITYEGANAQHSDTQSSANVGALSFNLSFAGLALLEIEQGICNATYFGSSAKPGPLAVYNSQALVGFKPSWSIQLAQSHQSNSDSSTSGGADISILGILDLGGYGGSTSNNMRYDNATNTLTIEDDSNNAYIIGFVQNTYY
ncbi:hypothetical protein DFH07DRAFT_961499 [Mycena maculata]|uniref:Uncharacterized protein n=1 Tax=Mycena maculata TaxID=230809 RepID=A0AAD7N7I5_9AGAR|nr:hypothetical protein DFH07DRAFT_961499 [Mycena maculata]